MLDERCSQPSFIITRLRGTRSLEAYIERARMERGETIGKRRRWRGMVTQAQMEIGRWHAPLKEEAKSRAAKRCYRIRTTTGPSLFSGSPT